MIEQPEPGAPPANLCPECKQGKCGNCDGVTWDFDLDDYRACECSDEEHA